MESAETAVAAGADFLGFNFVLSSKRYINPLKAKAIIEKMRKKTEIAGIFQNAHHDEINELIKFLPLEYVQLHGNEDEQFIKKIKTKVIKAFSIPEEKTHEEILTQIKQYPVAYFLLDRMQQGQGDMLDITKAQVIAQNLPVFLAGGLHPDNVADIITQAKPFGVDVASGIETDGMEDLGKIQQFVKNAKGAEII